MKALRRGIMRRSLALAVATALTFGAAGAQAQEKITVWFPRSSYPAGDKVLQDVIAKFKAGTGVDVELAQFSPEDSLAKAEAAVEAGTPPDIGFGLTYDLQVTGRWAYEGKLEDIGDVIGKLKSQYLEGPLSTAMLLNGRTGRRAYYAAPVEQELMQIQYWADMLQDAGFQDADVPEDWNGFWDFWCGKVQDALRRKGQRVFGVGQPASTRASDTVFSFYSYMNAYGARVVDDDGRFVLDRAENRTGFVKALAGYAAIVSRGCSPAASLNWRDSDNDRSFAARTTVLTSEAGLTIPLAQLDAMNRAHGTAEQRDAARLNYAEKIRTRAFPDKPGGGRMPALSAVKTVVIFADAEHKKRAREFLAYFLAEENLQAYVEASRGRWVPVTKNALAAPFWSDGSDSHRAQVVRQLVAGTIYFPLTKNWKLAAVDSENVWGRAMARIVRDRLKPEAAADEAIKRIREILER
jgi:multiple sugar transport system substrate-binding protein